MSPHRLPFGHRSANHIQPKPGSWSLPSPAGKRLKVSEGGSCLKLKATARRSGLAMSCFFCLGCLLHSYTQSLLQLEWTLKWSESASAESRQVASSAALRCRQSFCGPPAKTSQAPCCFRSCRTVSIYQRALNIASLRFFGASPRASPWRCKWPLHLYTDSTSL